MPPFPHSQRRALPMFMPLMKLPAFLLLATLSLGACAQDASSPVPPAQDKPAATTPAATAHAPGSPEAVAEAAIHSLQPDLQVERIGPAPLPGFRQAIVGGQVVYVSDDGKYLIQGVVLDIPTRRNLADMLMDGYRAEQLATVPATDRIIFAPANPTHTVAVLTDAECGFCRRFHQDIAEYNRLGIAVEYIAFPRMGPASKDFADMESIWCASDRRKALTDAKAGRPVPARSCTSPVASQYAMGQRIGLTGTPMVLTRDGAVLGGYLSPEQLKSALDAHAKSAAGGQP